MGKLLVKNLIKRFPGSDSPALDGVSFTVEEGEIVALLGPSGCGKTTTLRCIAGLEHPDQGEIWLDDRQITLNARHRIRSERRGMGMVFQSYSIWPHMTVNENIAIGLRAKGLKKAEAQQKIEEVLELVRLPGLASRPATDLSGGQQQRVALARSLALEPKVLLFDEPLSNLDANLREQMRFELRELLQRLAITSVYVTHDQTEAFVISDKICVIQLGKLVQVGTPTEIYQKPAIRFVAEFIGSSNILSGVIRETNDNQVLIDFGNDQTLWATGTASLNAQVDVSIRPEGITLSRDSSAQPDNALEVVINQSAYMGSTYQYIVLLANQSMRITTGIDVKLEVGEHVCVVVPPDHVMVLGAPPESDVNKAA
jgi:ABC-type Fe3+/spermidine/putrescine transport system ATPase subunit